MLTGRMIKIKDSKSTFKRLLQRSGEPVIRQAVRQVMRIMGRQFVMGRTIKEALERARETEKKGYTYSYDMLGEAARTAEDAERYMKAYSTAIDAIGKAAQGRGPVKSPGISVKLSALHPRYELAQGERVLSELVPRLKALAVQAKGYDIGFTVDAEEADRLDISLEVLDAVSGDPELKGWNGFGLALQAYQKRAFRVIDWLADMARRHNRRLMVRLIKGAYWDTEIKRAQERSLPGYPVFTRKASTDVSYLACARKLLGMRDEFYPQFATHTPETAHNGSLYLFQRRAQLDAYVAALGDAQDGALEVLDRDALIAREPVLARMGDRLVGGVFCRIDSVGDCRRFATRLCEWLGRNNRTELRFDTAVTGFRRKGRHIEAVETDAGPLPCAEVVLATGVETPDSCRPLGFAPRIYPVKGYSGTWRILESAGVPRLPFIDETELVAVASYGDRLRVTAIAEFAGRDRSLPADRMALLDGYVRRNFGAAVDLETPEFWAGLRPSTPAGPPYVGRVRQVGNLWINAGHGHLGWTMARGCGEILAQRIRGETPTLTAVSATAPWLEPA